MSKQKRERKQDHNTNHELLTVREVADTLRVDGTTVRRWVKNGALEAVTLPHRNSRLAYRIKRDTVTQLLNGGVA
jgi:excisionase family DNA binding protein